MKRFLIRSGPALLGMMLLASCGTDTSASGLGMQSYKDTKSMVLDILKTEDGKKTIQQALTQPSEDGQSDGGMKMQMLLASPQGEAIQTAVKEILTDPRYPEMLKTMMTDPKFAGAFAKAVKKDNKQILKDLMKDPEYQTLMMDSMKGPEFQKMMLDVLKSPAYRQQTMTLMKQALENPLYRVEIMDLMKKVMEEQSQPKSDEAKLKEDTKSQGGDSGSSGGGGASKT